MTRESRGGVAVNGASREAYYCASCGTQGGWSDRAPGNYVLWVCDVCHEKHGPLEVQGLTPIQAQAQRLTDVQLEEHGRLLSALEIHKQLSDVNSPLSILARDFPR
jgi:hypothetical protein